MSRRVAYPAAATVRAVERVLRMSLLVYPATVAACNGVTSLRMGVGSLPGAKIISGGESAASSVVEDVAKGAIFAGGCMTVATITFLDRC